MVGKAPETSAMVAAGGGAAISAGFSCVTGTLRLRVLFGFGSGSAAGAEFCALGAFAAATLADLALVG